MSAYEWLWLVTLLTCLLAAASVLVLRISLPLWLLTRRERSWRLAGWAIVAWWVVVAMLVLWLIG